MLVHHLLRVVLACMLLIFVQVDVDDVEDLAVRYKIQFVPTLKLLSKGNTTPAAESGKCAIALPSSLC